MNQTIDHFNTNVQANNQDEETIDIKSILAKVINNWYLFLIGISVCLSLAFIYAYYASPSWNITSKILVEDPKKGAAGGIGGESTADLSSLFNVKSSADNEVQILKSRSLMTQLIQDLHLNTRIYYKNGFKKTEIYDGAPFEISTRNKSDSFAYRSYEVEILDAESFQISNSEEKINLKGKFGDSVSLKQYNIVLNKTASFYPAGKYLVNIQTVEAAFSGFSQSYSADLSDKQSSTIDLTLTYNNPKKGEVILESLMQIYIRSNLENKVRIADSTMRFIDDRLSIVSRELGAVEKELQQYKQENNLADISTQSKALIESSTDYFNKLNEQNIQLAVVNDLQSYLNKPGNRKIVPSSLTTKDPSFGIAINAYNELVLSREKLKLSYTEENPVVTNLDQQIESARQNLMRSLETYRKGLQISKAELAKQSATFTGQIKGIPQKERVFLDYSRQQNLKQELYLFLMQKREETAISKTSTISSSRIIDHAKSDYLPFKPKKTIIYLIGFILGLILPAIYLFIKELFNIKIQSKHDIDRATHASVLGEISHNNSGKNLVADNHSRSVISEQFRSLRTNLQFTLDNSKSNVLLFTSSMSGEGKSFLSLNIGSVLALSGKKVVFIELDLRKPKLSSNIGLDHENGFTNYVISDKINLQSILKPVGFNDNCKLISAGPIPPNPSELLMDSKLGKMIDELKESFDYIIIDCAPIGLVADALLIEKYADLTLYVVRQGYTYKSQLQIVNDLKQNERIKKLYLIVNDIPLQKGGYGAYGNGYGYGYGYGGYLDEEKGKTKGTTSLR